MPGRLSTNARIHMQATRQLETRDSFATPGIREDRMKSQLHCHHSVCFFVSNLCCAAALT
jgi:hypothetical protein